MKVTGLDYPNEGIGKPSFGPCCVLCGGTAGQPNNRAVIKTDPDPEQRHGYSPTTYVLCDDEFHEGLPGR